MTNDVENITLDILKNIQGAVMELHRELADLREDMKARFGSVEEQLRKQRRNNAGMLVMMQATAGHFSERLTDLEKRLGVLESHTG